MYNENGENNKTRFCFHFSLILLQENWESRFRTFLKCLITLYDFKIFRTFSKG